jgi:hypothetical protein
MMMVPLDRLDDPCFDVICAGVSGVVNGAGRADVL